MDDVILTMLKKYHCQDASDYELALKQIMQQIVLLGLWRAKFFEHAAFYGGTALRVLYQLDRFSEDLDFSLLEKKSDFNLSAYFQAVIDELAAFGFVTSITAKEKQQDTAIESAFLKANTAQHLLSAEVPAEIRQHVHHDKAIKIKFEVDTDPPLGFDTETRAVIHPIPFWVRSYSLPDLFAGKLSAVLCRQWQRRVKGRDWYDFLWFVQQVVPVHLSHLEKRLRQFGFYEEQAPLDERVLKKLLQERVANLDVSLAKQDIQSFIKDSSRLDAWSQDMFMAVIEEIHVC